MKTKNKLTRQDTILLVIDVQDRLRPHMNKKEDLVDNIKKLIKSFNIMGIPMILTEQYPKGLGKTIKEIKDELKNYEYIEKICFDCFDNGGFAKKIKAKNLVICGIETHVCVLQTVLSALSRKFDTYVVADAVSSRKQFDYEIAIRRMENIGAKLTTTEMIIFQLLRKAGTPEFKEVQKIIK